MTATETKIGCELDLAVAQATGKEATIYFDHDLQENICLLLPDEKKFAPSIDLNDAFDAAEKISRNPESCRSSTGCNFD